MEKELVQVVDGSQEFDLGVHAGGASVVEVASESLEELSEAGFEQGTIPVAPFGAQPAGTAVG
ncbi:hypothetical protein ABT061_14575 [Streptosporangium sp. NPDC002544]|uniref:hypothetical protein n=1 Tax=Streptosporangium sp. NPDC002544 TaxID=3154538 RepID=UPI0033269589